MKKPPNEKTLNKLLDFAKDFEQKALSVYEITTEIDDKWCVLWELKSKVVIAKSDDSQD
ncbi:MAG: hypothetical protein AAF383_04510 [Cyanobacteria bacterium P01_A01_bin.83]